MNQYNLKFNIKNSFSIDNYIKSNSNKIAYNILINSNEVNYIFLFGPKKSGKTHLSKIWCNQNKAKEFKLLEIINEKIFNLNYNIFIDDIFDNIDEEKLFHLINHMQSNKFKLLITSNIKPKMYNFLMQDLSSRIKSFHFIEIYKPDDYLITNLILKLFKDRQINIKNKEVIDYMVTRIDRTFDSVYSIVSKIDNYSLTNKREITIPLIKELLT